MNGPSASQLKPAVLLLGDSFVLVRFDAKLTDSANKSAIALAAALGENALPGVLEVMPNLVSVLLRYDPHATSYDLLAGELRILLFGLDRTVASGQTWNIPVRFDGADLNDVAAALGMSVPQFITAHGSQPLRVLATGFAPGFVYCGLHGPDLTLPRRPEVRPSVPAGSVLFAAGQTAITATEMPTGWHVIGHTTFNNFDPMAGPPTRLRAGDHVRFEPLS